MFGLRARRVLLTFTVASFLVAACTGGSNSAARVRAPSTSPPQRAPSGADAGTSQPTGKTYSVPHSIPPNCSSDVTASLSQWIARVPDNSTLVLDKGACYRVDGTLAIADRRDLLFDGNGATVKATTKGTRTRVHVQITDSENIIVRNITIRGANPHAGATPAAYDPKLEAQHGFNLGSVRRVLLDNVQVYDVYGDFVYVASSSKNRNQPSDHVAVVRSHFARSGRQGISVVNGMNVTVAADAISDVARSMFDLEPNVAGNTVRAVRIEQNTTGPAVNFWIAAKGAGNQVGDVVVRSNIMRSPTGGLVFVFGGKGGARGPFTFERNHLQLTGGVTDEGAVGALFFAHTDSISVRNNRIDLPRKRSMPVVQLRSCQHVAIDGNRVKNAKQLVMADGASRNVQSSR
jgi:hypothetical protein